MRWFAIIFGLLPCFTANAALPALRPPNNVSFRNDVMAVFAKAGCNAGACHGNKNGKGGFKLSLRGQDPDFDYAVLTRDLFARRTNLIDPDHSLVLLKPTTQVPHEGGLRFRTDSLEYRILRRWIDAGEPSDDQTFWVVRKPFFCYILNSYGSVVPLGASITIDEHT